MHFDYRRAFFAKLASDVIDYLSFPLLQKGDLKDDVMLISNYEESELRLIGQGGFGKVFLVRRKN